MDHDHARQSCAHGMCIDHNPELGDVIETRWAPNPTFFLRRTTYLLERCCGKRMRRVKEVQVRQCRECGSKEEEVTQSGVALCDCCGRHDFATTQLGDPDPMD